MRGLAQFAMAGRRQAVTSVLLLGLLPIVNLLSPVLVGLVMLSKGAREALLVTLWAVLPLMGWTMVGEFTPLLMLPVVAILALLLRETDSWQTVLLTVAVMGFGIDLYLRTQPEQTASLLEQIRAYMDGGTIGGLTPEELRELLPGSIAAFYMFLAVALLILARWFQAMLYNPGGFRGEFHGLRLSRGVGIGLTAAILLVLVSGDDMVPTAWALYPAAPLLMAGVALVHGLMALHGLPAPLLVMFYIATMLMPHAVVVLAIIDNWYDFRKRTRR